MQFENLAQFKFSNGQEVVCEVMEWPQDKSEDIIVRNAMSIIMGEDQDGDRVYMFRPWAHYLEANDEYILVNTLHVVSTNRPSVHLQEEYKYAVNEMHKHRRQRDVAAKQEELQAFQRLQNAMVKMIENDSTGILSNVLPFPKRDDILH